jgi:serine/threonine protein kinase
VLRRNVVHRDLKLENLLLASPDEITQVGLWPGLAAGVLCLWARLPHPDLRAVGCCSGGLLAATPQRTASARRRL